MNTIGRSLRALAIAAAMHAGLIGLAIAQTSRPEPAGGTAAYGGAIRDQANASEPVPQLPPSADLPVLFVTDVEVLRTTAEPKLDIVRAIGLASSQGWTAPQLVPTYAGRPADDILDLELIATPPAQSQDASGFVPVDALFPLAPGHPFKGVRVRASENVILVKQMPGRGQATIHVNDCTGCVGKRLVQDGSGQSQAPDGIHPNDLPKTMRLITPSEGIRGAEQNPNRLSLILDEDNTIVEAFWE